jgi:Uma2 family endonuclease
MTTLRRLSVDEYFELPETMRPMELVYGVVREPPAPRYAHQALVTHLGALMDVFVRRHQLGKVCVSPVDVVLDESAALVVQPDIIFVGRDRLSIIRERIFGPPDLVVEILSPRTARRDRTTKLAWYQQYGVRECWLVDVKDRSIDVVAFQAGAATRRKKFSGSAPLQSAVLLAWAISADEIFD